MVFAGVILVLTLNFLGTAGGVHLVTTYLFPLFEIGIPFSWNLVLGVFGVIILLKTIFSNSIHFKS